MNQAQALIQIQGRVNKYIIMKKEKIIKNIIWCTLLVLFLFGLAIVIDITGEDNGLGDLFFTSLFLLGYTTFTLLISILYVLFLLLNKWNTKFTLSPIATFFGVSDIIVFIIGIFIIYKSPQSKETVLYFATTLVLGSFILYKQFKCTSST